MDPINPISSENPPPLAKIPPLLITRSEMALGGRKIDLFFSDFEAFLEVFECRNALKRRIYGQK